ncbi:alkyl/aryl-sulfatase [Actinomycetospora chibensis]|uniref:Alkyl/aryl-sulfatase n=1 Tax=Actinomycetospora chibensis TaxID=663606 RepID=A0ABV9RN09_9PSEU|nr:alkyl sulfatase dimerization domain-containing protein [Actinomycetospora chibensis]MDD7922726.1 alkyl sulfatase dimerization domain-containing protein [Actinomycetospora chibensis]
MQRRVTAPQPGDREDTMTTVDDRTKDDAAGPSFADTTDVEDAGRGLVERSPDPRVLSSDGERVVWDFEALGFLERGCPPTVNPSLWRQSRLTAMQGLYEVTEGIYQIRGFDLSNMTLLEGDRGVVVVDPLFTSEVAAAGLALYRRHRGDRPVTAVIYTHSHGDHFGGVLGVVDADTEVPVVAPEGFLEHAVAENVYAGTAMSRRGIYMYGMTLPKDPSGVVGTGLGPGGSTGTFGLVAPTVDITRTGQIETLDGVDIEFQLTPGTEAPSEMNFLVPSRRALCMAENATHNLHNILTLRGAVVRDAHVWSQYLDEAVALYVDRCDVLFASHHWPTWGRDRIRTFLTQQRDLYAYLHDQTLRLLNQGHTGPEIAELIELPPALRRAWHTQGYYGSVSHNVKAIYQRYLGWFDGNPARLWPHPPEASAHRYVEALGGQQATVATARRFADAGDLRFAAQLLDHAVFADPADTEATGLLADVFERLGQGAENATWRNFYLTGAQELRHGVTPTPVNLGSPTMLAALTVEQLLDAIAIRVDGPRAWNEHLVLDLVITDQGRTHRCSLSNGVLIHSARPEGAEAADLAVTLTKAQLPAVLAGHGLEGIDHDGDPAVLERLLGLLDQPDGDFRIVTP